MRIIVICGNEECNKEFDADTNEPEWNCPHCDRIIKNKTGLNSMADFMEKVYYSHEIGYKKPDPRAYEFVLEENKLDPMYTLFIDDLKLNINMALKLGMKVFQLTDINKLVEYFEKI